MDVTGPPHTRAQHSHLHGIKPANILRGGEFGGGGDQEPQPDELLTTDGFWGRESQFKGVFPDRSIKVQLIAVDL